MALMMAGMALAGAAMSADQARKDRRAADKASKRQTEAMDRQTDVLEKNIDFARDRWNQYRESYGGLEADMIDRAQRGVDVDRMGMTGEVRADTADQFASQREQQAREMSRYGIDPTSGRFQGGLRASRMNEASATASGMRDARKWGEEQDFSRRRDMMGIGLQVGQQAERGLQNARGALAGAEGQQAGMHNQNAMQYEQMASQGMRDVGRGLGMAGTTMYMHSRDNGDEDNGGDQGGGGTGGLGLNKSKGSSLFNNGGGSGMRWNTNHNQSARGRGFY